MGQTGVFRSKARLVATELKYFKGNLRLAETGEFGSGLLHRAQTALSNTDRNLDYRLELDAESFRLLGYEIQQNGVTQQRVAHLAFTQIDEVEFPSTIQVEDPEMGTTRFEIESTRIGVGIYDDYFSQQPQHSAEHLAKTH